MEYKDPMHELLSSLEQIVFKDETQKITLTHRTTSCTEIEQLRKGTGLKIDDFCPGFGRISRHGKGMGIQTREAFKCRTKIDAFDSSQPGIK